MCTVPKFVPEMAETVRADPSKTTENKQDRWCREGELNPHEVAFDGF